MYETKRVRVPLTLTEAAAGEGAVQAVFSVFNEVDTDGDIVLASAFTDGQAVPLVWAHDWMGLPVGKGVIRVRPDAAVFDGAFFLETQAGADAYRTVKAMGELQEYSWGFRILQAKYGEVDGQTVRYIERAEVFEVSPVLVGANRNTYTLAIKSEGEPLADQIERVLADVAAVKHRTESLADLRRKEGRAISAARRDRLSKMIPTLREIAGDLEALLEETAPPEKAAGDAVRASFLAIQAELARSAVGV
jgi:HK97 family phage prohead protease